MPLNKTKHNQSGENNPMWGRHHSEETKAKISKANKGNIGLPGKKNPMYGKRYTEEEKRIIGIRTKKALSDPVVKKKLSNAQRGRKHSEETKAKIRNSTRGIKRSEETKEKMRRLAKLRFSDPTKNVMYSIHRRFGVVYKTPYSRYYLVGIFKFMLPYYQCLISKRFENFCAVFWVFPFVKIIAEHFYYEFLAVTVDKIRIFAVDHKTKIASIFPFVWIEVI